MKIKFLTIIMLSLLFHGCGQREAGPAVYRFYVGKKSGLDIWIVDGYKVRHKIYKEFLYGGNGQRYCYTPASEIWIDNAISCEEYELTLAHELNERHLMAKFGWTYDRSHDSSLAVELVMRHVSDSICRSHEASLRAVAPSDWSNRKEISTLPDSIRLTGIYRIPAGIRNGVTVWIVDGYLVRKNIFPDFGFSGNDLVYHFIPAKEIWIDGQISCEEMEYSIAAEEMERNLMQQGKSYSDAYEASVEYTRTLRDRMEGRISNHPPLVIPDTLQREMGIADPNEK
ncbi:MAG: hypothetical protein NT040_09085 [Bacteroidetes bacterium]|nr:hypothetical protein [Bacteroidota bacterium]